MAHVEAADITLTVGLVAGLATVALVVTDTVRPDMGLLDFERQRAATLAVFALFLAAIVLRHCG